MSVFLNKSIYHIALLKRRRGVLYRLWPLLILVFILWVSAPAKAQDIHFSQYYNTPLNLNPAKAGYFMGSHRFALNYKNQWQSVTTPYRTLSASFDMPVIQRGSKLDMVGAGILLNADKAGDASYGTTQASCAISYIKSLSRLNNHYLSFAIQPGIMQKSIKQDKLSFDSQYDGTSLNTSLPQNETFARTNFIFFDISAGIYWNYQMFNNTGFDAGLSVFHINKPSQTFYNDATAVLHRKVIVFGNAIFQVSDRYDLVPGIYYARQYNYKEFLIGSTFRYVKSPNPINFSTFNLGMFFRTSDALLLVAGFDYLQYSFAISYDVNYSDLKPASRAMGGLEASFKYILDSKRSYVRKVPCPIF